MDYREVDINKTWSAEGKVDLYRQMARIRRFEQAAMRCYCDGKMAGFLVLDIGQESIAVTVRSLMGPDDHGISGWRGLGHALAAGMDMGACMAELFGKTSGCSKGKGGAFSFFDPAKYHWGCHATAAGAVNQGVYPGNRPRHGKLEDRAARLR